MAAWFWLIAWGLWWLIVALGVQGTSPVIALIGLLGLPILLKKRPRFSLDVQVFSVFALWCVASVLWSGGGDKRLIVFDMANNNYAFESPGLRLSVAAFLTIFAFWVLNQVPAKMYARVRRAAQIGLGIVFIMSLISVPVFVWIFWGTDGTMAGNPLLDRALPADERNSLLQNLLRSTNLVVLSIPLFVAMLPFRKLRTVLPLFAGIAVTMAVVSLYLGGQAAFLAVFVVTGVSALTLLIGRMNYRVLGFVSAFVILLMPVIISGVVAASKGAEDSLPRSFRSRLHSYEYVLDRIEQKWLAGWGVEASKNWKDTGGVTASGRGSEYRIVPGHPHNMGLQIWAETGLIGAVLLALFSVLLGERLYRTATEDRAALIAGTAVWGGALVYATLSYSLWNDAFWTGIVFLASGVLLIARTSDAGRQTT